MFEKFLTKHSERIVGLDILRTVAILLVVYWHGINLIPKKFYPLYKSTIFLNIDGVTIFFVLSGFLIGGILLKTINNTNFTGKDLLKFWIRRWFRTLPNYYLVLIGIVVIRLMIGKGLEDFNFKYFFFVQNFFTPHPFFFSEAWSLAVEEWFYLLFPLFCYALYKISNNKSKSILIAALIFIFIPLLIRIVKYEFGLGIAQFDLEYRKIMILRLDSLMYGVIGAYLQYKHQDFWRRYKQVFLIIGIFLVVLMKMNPLGWKEAYGPIIFNIESITTFCFLPFLSSYKSTKIKLIDAFFIFISIISYSMYLLNLSVINDLLIPYLDTFIALLHLSLKELYFTNYFLFWFFTVLCSYVLYKVFEHPFTQLRDKVKIK